MDEDLEKLLFNDMVRHSESMGANLKSHLNEPIELRVGAEKVYVDWSGSKLAVARELKETPACQIQISKPDLMKIKSGSLNPQIAIISNRIQVTGSTGLAIYFFNLLAPRSQA